MAGPAVATVAKLVDAIGLGPIGSNTVLVRVQSVAPLEPHTDGSPKKCQHSVRSERVGRLVKVVLMGLGEWLARTSH